MKKLSKSTLTWLVVGLVVLSFIIGLRLWNRHKTAVPEGIASGNGRLESNLVDIAAKEPLRVKEITVDEGSLVNPGQVLATLETNTLEAELAEAKAQVAASKERLEFSRASIAKNESEIELADIELVRSGNLVKEGAGSQRELDTRRAQLLTAKATLTEARAALEAAKRQVEAAEATAEAVQTRIDDATLESPVTGRVLYRLAEVGEVLAPGGKVLTVVDLEDVYMEIFLPAEEAAKTTVGAEARITFDYDPSRALPGTVSFVSPEAQFTPKQVETKSEREKLMFRVKIQLPKELGRAQVERIKTGVRGMGYVKIDPSAEWPEWLQHLVMQPRAQR